MANNPAELVLLRLENVIAGPIGSWSARCPAHDDVMNSLSIGEGRDGARLAQPGWARPAEPSPKLKARGGEICIVKCRTA